MDSLAITRTKTCIVVRRVRFRIRGAASVAIEGRYANYLEVGSNAVEFMLDFGQYVESGPAETIVRIFTSPAYAREFLAVLRQAVENYEARYGSVLRSPDGDD
jgi:hypothetical protein